MEFGINLWVIFPLVIADRRKIVLDHSVPSVELKSKIYQYIVKTIFTTGAITSQAAIRSISLKLLIGMLTLPIKYSMDNNTKKPTSIHNNTGICTTEEAMHKTTSGINLMVTFKTTGFKMVTTTLIRQLIIGGQWWEPTQLGKTWRLTTLTWIQILISTLVKPQRTEKIRKGLMEKKTSCKLIPVNTWTWTQKWLLTSTQHEIGSLLPLIRRLNRRHWMHESSKYLFPPSSRHLRKPISK